MKYFERMPNFDGEGACKDADPELFFPINNESTESGRAQIEEAKAVCRRCEVASACLRFALDTDQEYGVWGGHSESERRVFKRQMARVRRAG